MNWSWLPLNILKSKSDVADSSAHPLLKYSFSLETEDRPAVDGIELGCGFSPCLCPRRRLCYPYSEISVTVLCPIWCLSCTGVLGAAYSFQA